MVKEFLKDKIVGTWKLKSWIYNDENGNEIHYLGKDASGILMYDRHGYMNAQLMKGQRVNFGSDSINGGTLEETNHAFNTYLAYFGRYREEQPGAIIHTVEGSLFPNWIGNEETRYGNIKGNTLQLHTPPIAAFGREIVFYITWQRV